MGLRIYLRYIACKWCRTKMTKMAIPFPAPPNLSTAAHCTYAPQFNPTKRSVLRWRWTISWGHRETAPSAD
ncbi:unnamed protein product, partial [Ectocarpus sp. 12 AP-2014]